MKLLLQLITLLLVTTTINAQGWGQTQKIVPDDRFSGQQFGATVDIDGNYAVVGVLVSNSARDAYVYENDGNGNWVQLQKLESPDPHQFAHFGTAVAVSGDYIFVGSWGQHYDENGADFKNSAGAAYIFKKETTGLFEFHQKIVASDRESLNAFGYGLAVNGDYAIVSPVRHDFDASGNNFLDDAGAAYIFEKDGAGTWNEVQKIVASDRAIQDFFGQEALAVEGNYIAVGSYGDDEDENGENILGVAGSVYIFERDGGGTWNEVQKIVASDREGGDLFGWDVAISGNFIVVGAYGEDIPNTGDSRSGATYVFEKDGNDFWNETQKIVASNRAVGDWFGHSVSIDGDYIIVGAYLKNFPEGDSTLPGVGRAYVFEKDGAGTWNQIQNMYSLDRAASDYFGFSVAISGDYAIVGAYQEDEDEEGLNFMQSAGSAYFFDANEPSTLSIFESDFNANLIVYPNPTQGILHIDLKTIVETTEVSVVNILGQQILKQTYLSTSKIGLNLENVPKGLYLVSLKLDHSTKHVLKIIKN